MTTQKDLLPINTKIKYYHFPLGYICLSICRAPCISYILRLFYYEIFSSLPPQVPILTIAYHHLPPMAVANARDRKYYIVNLFSVMLHISSFMFSNSLHSIVLIGKYPASCLNLRSVQSSFAMIS